MPDDDIYDEEEYEDEDEQAKDIDQIHLMYRTMLASLFQHKALTAKNIETEEGNINHILHKNRLQRWVSTVSYFMKSTESLRLVDIQIVSTYKQYLKDLQEAMQEIEDSGNSLNELHQLIVVLERQNTKLEAALKQKPDESQAPKSQKGTLPPYAKRPDPVEPKEPATEVKEEKEGVQVENAPEQPTAVPENAARTYGKKCKTCGMSLRGLAINAMYCKSCAETRARQARADAQKRRRESKKEV